jgi:hypothetical protein
MRSDRCIMSTDLYKEKRLNLFLRRYQEFSCHPCVKTHDLYKEKRGFSI